MKDDNIMMRKLYCGTVIGKFAQLRKIPAEETHPITGKFLEK